MTDQGQTESKTRGSPLTSRLITIGVMLVLPVVGLLGGAGYSLAAARGALTTWRRLRAPPAKAVEILGGNVVVVYVKTTDDKVYSCRPSDSQCWIETTWPQDFSGEPCDWTLELIVSRPPGQVVDRLDTHSCPMTSEVIAYTSYVLLGNGSLWVWEYFNTGLSNLGRFFICITCGPVLGLVGGIVIARAVRRRQSRHVQVAQ